MQMQRIVGGLVAAVATVALWGCDAVKNFVQSSLPIGKATAAPVGESPVGLGTNTPRPTVPITFVIDPTPEPTPAMGTVIITPDASASWNSPTPTPSPTPTSQPTMTPRPLWAAYLKDDFGRLNPEGIQTLQAWRDNGVKLFHENWDSANLVTGMARDDETGEVAYELTRLDPDEYGFVGGDYYPLKKNVAIDGRPGWGYPDWGFAGSFVERDGKFVFHKPGMSIKHGDYKMNIVVGYLGLPRHLNDKNTKTWDFSQAKASRKLIQPPGVFEGVEITLAPEIPLTFRTDSIKATYPVEISNYYEDELSQRIAYDEQRGVLMIAGWSEESHTPVCWWGAVRDTSAGKRLYVGTKQRLWYLTRQNLAEARIVSWLVKDSKVYALRGAGRESCDKLAYGRASRDSYVDCWLDTFKFPLDLIIDAPQEPVKKPQ